MIEPLLPKERWGWVAFGVLSDDAEPEWRPSQQCTTTLDTEWQARALCNDMLAQNDTTGCWTLCSQLTTGTTVLEPPKGTARSTCRRSKPLMRNCAAPLRCYCCSALGDCCLHVLPPSVITPFLLLCPIPPPFYHTPRPDSSLDCVTVILSSLAVYLLCWLYCIALCVLFLFLFLVNYSILLIAWFNLEF